MTSIALSALFMAQGATYLAAVSLLHALPIPAAPWRVAMFAEPRGVAAHESSVVPTHSIEPTDIDRAVQARSETEFSIDRTLFERIADASMQLPGRCVTAPHEENGRVVGVKIFGVRGSSLLGKLGIRNGDLLRTLNGLDLSDPSGALEAYALLRSANHLSLAIIRRGQPMTLEYDLH